MRIKNKTKSFTPGCTKEFIEVPDSNTDDYRLGQARQWLPRIYQEIKDYNESGGRVVFTTLTYRPQCVPRFNYIDEDGKSYSIPGFSGLHKNKFLQDIRNYLDYKYGLRGPTRGKKVKFNQQGLPVKYMSKSFRYMWPCEYGLVDKYIDDYGKERKGQHLPHYHPLFFLPKEMVELPEFRTEETAKKFFEQFWTYGMVRWSKPCLDNGIPLGIYVTSEFAAEYCSKYCFKSVEFFEQPEVCDFLYPDGSKKKNEDHYNLLKDYLPRHWQSKSFGVGLCQYYDNNIAMLDGVDFAFKKDVEKGIRVMTRCPNYIKRKLYYDQLPDGRYVINDKGIKMMVETFPEKVRRHAEKLKYDLLQEGFDMLTASLNKKDSNENLCYVSDLKDRINILVNGITFEELAMYQFVWQGLFVYTHLGQARAPDLDVLDSLDLSDFLSVSVEQYGFNIRSARDSTLVYDEPYFYDQNVQRHLDALGLYPSYYCECDRFRGFDELLDIRQKLRADYFSGVHKKYLEDRERRKRLKFNIA